MATATTSTSSRLIATGKAPALLTLLFGVLLVLGAGFAWPSAIHNATHDTRHALGLPCH